MNILNAPMPTSTKCKSWSKGFSLVELMVAMAIGLFVVMVVGMLYVNSKTTYVAQDANSRLQENARFAVELLGNEIRTAGYSNIDFSPIATANLFAKPPTFEFGGDALNFTEGVSAPDQLTVSYDSGTDCLGNATAPSKQAVNLYRINAQGQLECLGNGSVTAGVLLDDVEDMQLLYGQPIATGYTYVSAADAAKGDVDNVRVCLLFRAKADATSRANSGQTYLDCQGAEQTATDGFLRRTVTMTVALRNRIP